MTMKKLLISLTGFALIAGLHGAAIAADDAPAPEAEVTWVRAGSSIVYPTENTDRDAWTGYRGRFTVPSIDKHLTDPILNGAIDLHAHFGPDAYDRQWDAFEIAKLTSERGMRGLVFKNHWSESSAIASLVHKYSGAPGLAVFGGLALNVPVGGINPQAVRYFAEVEGNLAKVVWMPTHDAEHEIKFLKEKRPYVLVSENGVLIPEVLEVLDLIKHYDLTLATGHVTAKEMLQIMGEANKRGIERIIVTHPHMGPMYTDPDMGQFKQAIALGGYIEVVSNNLLGATQDEFIEIIRELGPEHCFISSDSGLMGLNNHSDALVLSIRILREAGFSEDELDLMFRKNPAFLVGLPALD